MKRLFTILLFLALATSAWAQYIPEGPLEIKPPPRINFNFRIDGKRLSQAEQLAIFSDINGTDYTKTWNTCRIINNISVYTFGAGTAVCLLGIGYTAYYTMPQSMKDYFGIGKNSTEEMNQAHAEKGEIVGEIGLYIMTLGYTAWWLGSYLPMRYLVFIYNNEGRKHSSALSFGPTRNGIGLALTI